MTKTLAVIACLTSGLALAQTVPGSITFNARLNDTGGTPVTGSHALGFGLYDTSTGGAALWTESVAGASFSTEGLAYVELGAVTPLTTSALDGRKLFLEVSVDGTAMSPRLAIVSVPYAIRSSLAASALAIGSLTESAIQRRVTGTCNVGQAVRSIDASGGVQCENLSGGITGVTAGNGLTGGGTTGTVSVGLIACTNGQILQHNGTTWVCATNSASGTIAGNAQVGVNLPLSPARFVVQGEAAVAGTGTISASAGATAAVGASTAFLSEVTVGDYIVVGGQTRKVTAVTSDTALTVDFAWSANLLVQAFTKQKGIAEFRNSAGATVLTLDARGNLAEATPWYAVTPGNNLSDVRTNSGVAAAGTWVPLAGRSVTYTKRLTSSALKITYQDTLGTNGPDYAGCSWRILVDGNQVAYFSDADITAPASWRMSNAAHIALVTGLAAGSHTAAVQNSRGTTTTECLQGWNTAGSYLLVEEIQ